MHNELTAKITARDLETVAGVIGSVDAEIYTDILIGEVTFYAEELDGHCSASPICHWASPELIEYMDTHALLECQSMTRIIFERKLIEAVRAVYDPPKE